MSYFSSSNKTSQKRNKIRQTYYTAEIIRLIACIKISTLDLYIFHLHLFVNPPHYPPSPRSLIQPSPLSTIPRTSFSLLLTIQHPQGFSSSPSPITSSRKHSQRQRGVFSKTAGSIPENSREYSQRQPGAFSKTAGSILKDSQEHSQRQSEAFSKTAGSVLEDSRENVSVLFSCDYAGMLETLSILLHRQGAQALRQFLAEGELTAAPSGCESVYAESLGFLAFRNRNKKTGQTHSPGVRAATLPICPRSHLPNLSAQPLSLAARAPTFPICPRTRHHHFSISISSSQYPLWLLPTLFIICCVFIFLK